MQQKAPINAQLLTPRSGRPLYATLAALGLLAVYAAIVTRLALHSDGTYMDDELTHFLFARSGAKSLSSLLNVWGRPGFTIPFVPAANVGDMAEGFRATRLMTVLVMLLAGFLTWRTAKLMRAPLAWLAPGVLMLSPFWMSLSYTPTTEATAALYSIAGTWMLARGNRRWAAIFFALLPVTRHEMIVMLVPVAFYFLLRRDWIALLLLGWAEGAWNLACFFAHFDLPLHRFFTKLPADKYGSGDWSHYVNRWMELISVGGVALVLSGIGVIAMHDIRRVRRVISSTDAGRRARLRYFVAAGAIGLVLLNGVLYHFNSFASGGYARFLTPAIPWMAITSLYGVALLWRGRRWTARLALTLAAGAIGLSLRIDQKIGYIYAHEGLRWAALAAMLVAIGHRSRWGSGVASALLIAIAVFQVIPAAHPYKMTGEQQLLGSTIRELHARFPGSHIAGATPWLQYFNNELMSGSELGAGWRWEHNDPPGVIYLYDKSHAPFFKPFEWFARYPYAVVGEYYLEDEPWQPCFRALRRLPGMPTAERTNE